MSSKAYFVSVVVALGLAGCGNQTPTPDQNASAVAQPDGPTSVTVVPVKSAVLSTKVSLPGQFVPFESVDLYPKVTGFIERIYVDRGSHVRRGQILVQLSAPEVAAQQGQAAAALRAAQAKLASDQTTYTRLANAAKTPGVVAENDVDVARQLAAADAAQVQSARQAAGAARDVAGYLTIRAPFDGVITARNLHPGAIAGASGPGTQPILQLAKSDRLRMTVAVPENDLQGTRTGQPVTFTAPTSPGKTFTATISRMAHAVDPRTRTMMVEADVAGTDELAAGSFVSVTWPITRSYPTLRVPPGAITNDQQRQFVIRVANGKASWVDVTTGMSVDGMTEVFGAIRDGDLVVEHATDAIHDGAAVNPKKKPAS